MQVDPECVSALCGLAGLCQEELGDSQRARKLLEKALQLQPQHVDSLFQRGSLAEEEGGRAAEARALKWYRRAATLDPTHVPALVSAADLLAGTGEYAEAERMYKQVNRCFFSRVLVPFMEETLTLVSMISRRLRSSLR